jgi:SAM-dependent methyltransferase
MVGIGDSAQAWARLKALSNAPWKARLQAWWEGYEWADPGLAPEAEDEDDDLRLFRGGGDGAEPALAPAFEEHSIAEGWTKARIKLNEKLWGEGFVSPGGEKVILELIAPLGLNEEASVVDLGCGLGGSTRAITKTTNAWVSGYEADKALAEAAMERATMAGLAKRAAVQHLELKAVNIRRRTIDCVFSKEALFAVDERRKLFQSIHKMLKIEGHFLFTDFFLAGADAAGPATEVWSAHEPTRPELWTVEATSAALEGLGFEVRITEDITGPYQERVVKGFSKLLGMIQKPPMNLEFTSWAAAEAEHWARRVAVLESGEVKVFRIYARLPLSV